MQTRYISQRVTVFSEGKRSVPVPVSCNTSDPFPCAVQDAIQAISDSRLKRLAFTSDSPSAFKKCLGSRILLRVAISDFGSEAPRSAVQSKVVDRLQSSHKGVRIGFDQDRKQGRGYYGELCFKIFATQSSGKEQELVDGGDVNWTQKC
ncbi:MAG TPA: hypothetical protein VNW25_05360 [Candidatus Sulfotelmatobacter sp.]|nr:hypothetical protein [Candidatus Sulfotelmatobacter sp.]